MQEELKLSNISIKKSDAVRLYGAKTNKYLFSQNYKECQKTLIWSTAGINKNANWHEKIGTNLALIFNYHCYRIFAFLIQQSCKIKTSNVLLQKKYNELYVKVKLLTNFNFINSSLFLNMNA